MSKLCPCTLGNSVSGALFNLRNAKKLSEEHPLQEAGATVLSRRVDTVYSLTRSSSSWAYLVKFRMETGEEPEEDEEGSSGVSVTEQAQSAKIKSRIR